jgi:hypothetical protein
VNSKKLPELSTIAMIRNFAATRLAVDGWSDAEACGGVRLTDTRSPVILRKINPPSAKRA